MLSNPALKTFQKKVLLLVPNLSQIGGVSNYYKNLDLECHKNIRYFFVNTGLKAGLTFKIFKSIGIYGRFVTKLAFEKYDIVHVNPTLDNKSFYRDAVFIFIALLFRKKVIVFFRGWEDKFEYSIKKSLIKETIFHSTYGRVKMYIVLGETFKRKLIKLGVNKNVRFKIETTLADDKFLHLLKIGDKMLTYDKELVFLFISRIEKEKGVFIAIDAFIAANKVLENRKMRLVIAGDGPDLSDVITYVREKNVNNIDCIGMVRGESKARVLLESHILLFPTFYAEGMPNCILEGMLFAMPIISRINAAIPEIVESGSNGFLSSSVDYKEFVPFIVDLASDKRMFKQMSLLNHSVAKERFVQSKVSERVLKIYEECLS